MKNWRFRLLPVYLILLLLSHLVRSRSSPEAPLTNGKQAAMLPAVSGERFIEQKIKFAYREFSPSAKDLLPVLILLHGSPMGSESFDDLAPALAKNFRIIVPDLPGFGASSAYIPDYSIRAHAKYVLQLMAHLKISQAHLVAYSMGGGVALNMAELAPEKIASLIMLSAIGVQELELRGDYHLNHAVHGVQLGLFWLLQEAFPHFGKMDRFMLNLRYARNFYDTDQRPLRAYLQKYEEPMLILHGTRDELVPFAVAAEHHRLVPQSELKTYASGHGLAFVRWQWLAPDIESFINKVETNQATTRVAAAPERLAAATLPFDQKQTPMGEGLGLVPIRKPVN